MDRHLFRSLVVLLGTLGELDRQGIRQFDGGMLRAVLANENLDPFGVEYLVRLNVLEDAGGGKFLPGPRWHFTYDIWQLFKKGIKNRVSMNGYPYPSDLRVALVGAFAAYKHVAGHDKIPLILTFTLLGKRAGRSPLDVKAAWMKMVKDGWVEMEMEGDPSSGRGAYQVGKKGWNWSEAEHFFHEQMGIYPSIPPGLGVIPPGWEPLDTRSHGGIEDQEINCDWCGQPLTDATAFSPEGRGNPLVCQECLEKAAPEDAGVRLEVALKMTLHDDPGTVLDWDFGKWRAGEVKDLFWGVYLREREGTARWLRDYPFEREHVPALEMAIRWARDPRNNPHGLPVLVDNPLAPGAGAEGGPESVVTLGARKESGDLLQVARMLIMANQTLLEFYKRRENSDYYYPRVGGLFGKEVARQAVEDLMAAGMLKVDASGSIRAGRNFRAGMRQVRQSIESINAGASVSKDAKEWAGKIVELYAKAKEQNPAFDWP